MKTDLDNLMQAARIEAILITGHAQHNPPMYYFTGGGHISHAPLVKRWGEGALLFYNPMERDEAAKTGLATRDLGEYRLHELIKQANGDMVSATVMCYQKMFADLGLERGRVALYGRADAGESYAIFSALQRAMPELEFVGQLDDSLLLQARATKDESEVDRIRHMGRITTQVVGRVADYLTSQRVRDGVLVKGDGEPLTIGEVKGKINFWLAELGAENPSSTDFPPRGFPAPRPSEK